MQATSLSLDDDTGILTLRLDDGAEFEITDPSHASAVHNHISHGGKINDDQRQWLQKYRVEIRYTNRERLRAKMKEIRGWLHETANR